MVSPEEFRGIGLQLGSEPEIHKVDRSSVFALWRAPERKDE
jgi:hypothetical protein